MKFASTLAPFFAMASTLASTHFQGISPSNSIGGASSYTCRSQDDWNRLAVDVRNNGFKTIRITGFDCDALELASNAAASNGLTIMAGIYVPGSMSDSIVNINNQVQDFKNAYFRWGSSLYVGLTIGNEVNDNSGAIMAKVYDVRGYLQSVGVWTPVSTVHTWVRVRDDPALCGADFVGANA
ncbi:hypothetical protein BDN72DRAFT_881880, partial [Pluteus cervinus]